MEVLRLSARSRHQKNIDRNEIQKCITSKWNQQQPLPDAARGGNLFQLLPARNLRGGTNFAAAEARHGANRAVF